MTNQQDEIGNELAELEAMRQHKPMTPYIPAEVESYREPWKLWSSRAEKPHSIWASLYCVPVFLVNLFALAGVIKIHYLDACGNCHALGYVYAFFALGMGPLWLAGFFFVRHSLINPVLYFLIGAPFGLPGAFLLLFFLKENLLRPFM